MKRPPWATVVGILGIIFACLGLIGAGQQMVMPGMMRIQKDMFSIVRKGVAEEMAREKADADSSEEGEPSPAEDETRVPPRFPIEMFKSIERMWDVPEWFGTWAVASGIARLLICGLYLFASIGLLQTKPFSIPLFYCAAGAGVIMGTLAGYIAISRLGFMGMAMMSGGMFGAIVDIVLIVVVATGDKTAFSRTGPPPLPA